MNNRCLGCGAILQNQNASQAGYTPNDINKKGYCRRCFRLINYNEITIAEVLQDENNIINEINNNADVVLYLLDFLNINNEALAKFKKIKGEKILLINKSDLIPRSIKKEKIVAWLENEYNIQADIIFISAKQKRGISSLINRLTTNNWQNVFLAGFTNCGKSTVLNALCEKYRLATRKITTSPIPNTTLDFIKIKINNNLTIIDTPGFIYHETFYQLTDFDLIKKLNPKQPLRPITYQLKSNASIIIEDKIRIENKSLNTISFTLYISNELNRKIVYQNNQLLKNLSCESLLINPNQDLVIQNVGFINIKDTCKINIYTNNSKLCETRNSFF